MITFAVFSAMGKKYDGDVAYGLLIVYGLCLVYDLTYRKHVAPLLNKRFVALGEKTNLESATDALLTEDRLGVLVPY